MFKKVEISSDKNNEDLSIDEVLESEEFNDNKKQSNIFNFIKNYWHKEEEKEEDGVYNFKLEEVLELEKYLKSKIVWQDHIIEKYINNFLLNTYRNENNIKNLWVFFNFWKSWIWKNFILELIAEKLWFWYYVYDNSSTNYIEASTLLWASDWYSTNTSIMETINEIAKQNDWRMILVFDEIEKWVVTDNWDINTFFKAIMNIINNRIVYTKNTWEKIDLSNYIFVFNSNIWFDNYNNENDIKNDNKIWFDVDAENNQKPKEKEIDSDYIENIFKNIYKLNISVFNRLKIWDNFFFFNPLSDKVFNDYLFSQYEKLKKELSYNTWYDYQKLPNINHFDKKIKKFDFTRWFRWINHLIFYDFKLYLITNYVYKNRLKNNKLNLW